MWMLELVTWEQFLNRSSYIGTSDHCASNCTLGQRLAKPSRCLCTFLGMELDPVSEVFLNIR
jgi:hypothetical protein